MGEEGRLKGGRRVNGGQIPSCTNTSGLFLQYRLANFSMMRSIFWASPGNENLDKKNLH